MKKFGFAWCMKMLFWMVLAGIVMGVVVMYLWNWLVPDIFGWKQIGFLQALGLIALARLLTGGFGGKKVHHHHKSWNDKFKAKWEGLSEDERSRLKQKFSDKWCQPRWPDEENSEKSEPKA